MREFQVVTNGYAAENGGASGGAINVVTKSGTNTIHGDAFIFREFGALDAPPPLEDTLGVKPDVTRFRGGFSMGGPVAKDRTFFYAAYEGQREHGSTPLSIDVPTTGDIAAFTGSGGVINPVIANLLTRNPWAVTLPAGPAEGLPCR